MVRTDFPDFDMLDAMIASALKKLLNTQIHFRKRVSVEEQCARKNDRFLRGRQIADMMYEHFLAMKQHKAYQICSTSAYKMTTSKISMYDGTKLHYQQVKHLTEMVLEGLYKSKLQDPVQLHPDCIGFV